MDKVKVLGNGSIEKTGKKNTYKLRHNIGFDEKTKKYITTPKRTFHGTKAEARAYLAEWKKELEGGIAEPNPKHITVGEYAKDFQLQRQAKVKSGKLSPLTYERDELDTRKIVDYFGEYELDALDYKHILKAYAKMRQEGLSEATIHKVHVKLNQILKDAQKHDIIIRNPCDKIDRGEVSRPISDAPHSLLEEQAISLIENLQTGEQSSGKVGVWLALMTGMRRGEMLGLIWKNVIMSQSEIKLEQQYAKDRQVRDLKTPASRRELTLDKASVEYLSKWRTTQQQQYQALGMEWSEQTPVCANELGSYMDPDVFSRWRRSYFVQVGLGRFTKQEDYIDAAGRKRKRKAGYEGATLHDLRHTQATLLIGMGLDLKTVQARLGHASPMTTITIYADSIKKKQQEAAAAIGDALVKPQQK
jgi:integrase